MKRSIVLAAFCGAVFAHLAGAYEYPLQFTPNPGYRGLVVAGYGFVGNNVFGTCSYYTASGPAGKGGGRGKVTNYQQTCTWDQYGNLLSVQKGAPAAPPPSYIKGSLVVYATNRNGDFTGTDSKLPGRGFINTPGGHYTWLTSNSHAILYPFVYTLTVMLVSDGDLAVDITGVSPSALHGATTLHSTTCNGEITVGETCSITITYDATKLTSATGSASDTLRIDLTSDAGEPHDFIQSFTILAADAP
jgi:hypothetical protein